MPDCTLVTGAEPDEETGGVMPELAPFKPSCENCLFWDEDRVNISGGVVTAPCRRRAPQLRADGELWPRVYDDDHCGDWQYRRREESANA